MANIRAAAEVMSAGGRIISIGSGILPRLARSRLGRLCRKQSGCWMERSSFSGGQALVSPSGELGFIGTRMGLTDLKRAEAMQFAVARERKLARRRCAADLAKANEVLRSCIDALASVPELDQFVGQVMAVITGQLGAASSALAAFNREQKTMQLELLFQSQ
jgi:hypothetical protein